MNDIFKNVGHNFSRQQKMIGAALAIFLLLGGLFFVLKKNFPVTATPEQVDIDSAMQVAQYPAGLQTVIVRMLISKNATVDELYFNPPSDMAGTDIITDKNKAKHGVFYQAGGGAAYQQAPARAMADDAPGTWFYNADFQVPNIGTTSTSDNGGNDIIAFLPNVRQSICQKIDTEAGISSIPVLAKALPESPGLTDNQILKKGVSTFPPSSAVGKLIGTKGEVSGQPFACFQNGADGAYVYYHVLVER